ncbi:MAG: oligosaccharide flippase family protein [Acidobacteriota bacterium]
MNTPHVARQTATSSLLMLGVSSIEVPLQLGTLAIVARLLEPRDFGLMAMAMAVAVLFESFWSFGFPTAVVQSEQLGASQVRQMMRYNLRIVTKLSLGLALSSPLIAAAFREPVLMYVLPVVALAVSTTSSTGVHLGLLRREMMFGSIAIGRLVANLLASISSIALAYAGAGVWALVGQHAVLRLVLSASRLVFWRLQGSVLAPDAGDIEGMLRVARDLRLTRVVEALGERLDALLTGLFVGASPLGFYSNARRWAEIPMLQVVQPSQGPVVSGLSRIRGESGKASVEDSESAYRSVVGAAFSAVGSLLAPMYGLLALEAPRIVEIVLGPQWLESAPLLRLLAAGFFADALVRLLTSPALAEGRSNVLARWSIVRTLSRTLGVCCGLPWGVAGVACGYAAANALLFVPGLRFLLQGSAVQLGDVCTPLLRPLVAVAGAFTVTLLATNALSSRPSILILLSSAVCFASAYALLWLALPGGRARFAEGVALLRQETSEM